MSETNNPLPEFFQLLGEAESASRRVDYFDLRSEDQKSVAEWKRLTEQQAIACGSLVYYAAEHRDALIAALQELK